MASNKASAAYQARRQALINLALKRDPIPMRPRSVVTFANDSPTTNPPIPNSPPANPPMPDSTPPKKPVHKLSPITTRVSDLPPPKDSINELPSITSSIKSANSRSMTTVSSSL